MARSGGISGVGVAMATAGGFLLYIGIKNVPVLQGIREIAAGRLPTPRPEPDDSGNLIADVIAGVARTAQRAQESQSSTPTGSGGDLGSRIVQAARKYLGYRYVFGGSRPSEGFDCSGLVTHVLVRDLGFRNLPNLNHTVVSQFLVWRGAVTIQRRQDMRPGDLVCWPGSHMGIAISPTHMIHAPNPRKRVEEARIWWTPAPVIRRVRPYSVGRGD